MNTPVLHARVGRGGSTSPGGTRSLLKTFYCDLCGYICSTKSKLTAHQRTHSGEKPFGCELCSYRCARKSNLDRHHRTHSGEKPFGCDLCSYRCAQKSTLTTHQRTHSGEKPFRCDLCSYRCARKGHLAAHHETHSGTNGKKPAKLSTDSCARRSAPTGDLEHPTGRAHGAWDSSPSPSSKKRSLQPAGASGEENGRGSMPGAGEV
jgi:uncharacterized Zn-finger protein